MADLTLALDASTSTGSLALLRGGTVVAQAQVAMRGHDGERLMPALVQLLGDADVSTTDLTRIVCGNGPGGFTSLRIAAAIGKGLAESLGVELWAASSLALLAAGDAGLGAPGSSAPGSSATGSGATGSGAPTAEVIAVLDALRGEWYSQRFGRAADGTVIAVEGPALVGREELAALARETRARIVGAVGDGFEGAYTAIPNAREVARLTPGALLAPVALAEWEPDYGRLAEAQVKWERVHGRALGTAG